MLTLFDGVAESDELVLHLVQVNPLTGREEK